MSAPCRVCNHPKRQTIESAYRDGAKVPTLVKTYHVGEGNLRRHFKNHMGTAGQPAGPVISVRADDPAKVLRYLTLQTSRILKDAEDNGTRREQLAALRQARENLEAVAKIRASEPPVYDPLRDELLGQLRDRLAKTLRDFPDALAAVRADFAGLVGAE